jgi:hypothetical protein
MRNGKNRLKRLARLRYAELMLKLQAEGWSVRAITAEVNKRLKISKRYVTDDGEVIQLSKTTISDFLKKHKQRYKGKIDVSDNN